MSAVTPGSGGTIKSATAEGQLHEIVSFISLKQASALTNPSEVSNVLASHDQNVGTFSGTFALTVVQSISGTGSLELQAATYLVGSGFHVGTGGTFKSSSPEGYLLEVLMKLQSLELDPSKNPQAKNYVTGSYNSDTQRYQGSFSLPVTLALQETGAVSYLATEYLL